MGELFYPLLLLACPIGMGLMMFFMGKGMLGGKKDVDKGPDAPERDPVPGDDLAELRAEQARISERIAAIEAARAPRDTAAR